MALCYNETKRGQNLSVIKGGNIMKKIIAVLCTVLLLFGTLGVSALAAEPYSAGLDVLKTQFAEGEGPETEGFAIEYLYFL